MCAPITKVNEGESNTPCPSTLEVTYSSVEKLSKALYIYQVVRSLNFIVSNRKNNKQSVQSTPHYDHDS
jgi:hypothetical protein